MIKALIIALVSAAAALPAPQSGSAIDATPAQSAEFALLMKVDGSFVSLNAVNNGTIGNLVLEAGRLSVYPGTTGKYYFECSNMSY
jgi:streptogramin lyase